MSEFKEERKRPCCQRDTSEFKEQRKRLCFLPKNFVQAKRMSADSKPGQLCDKEKQAEERVEANLSILVQALKDDRLDLHEKISIPVVKNRKTGAVEGFLISEGMNSGSTYAVGMHHLWRISDYCEEYKVAAPFDVSRACHPTPFPEDVDY